MNADPIAALYRWLEYAAFGRQLERCRTTFLPALRHSRRILILGEGDGRFLARLTRENPGAAIDVVDSSAAMIARARARAAAPVRFLHADARTAPFPACDAVVTHFFLDCFSDADVQSLVARLNASLVPGGLWVVSEFRQPPAGLAARYAALWLAVMYRFFRVATALKTARLPAYEHHLRAAGLEPVDLRHRHLGLITAQLWRKPTPTP